MRLRSTVLQMRVSDGYLRELDLWPINGPAGAGRSVRHRFTVFECAWGSPVRAPTRA